MGRHLQVRGRHTDGRDVPESARHAEFLAKRLRAMGLRVEYTQGESFARGQLELQDGAFPTLTSSLEVERVAFYTLGHNRLKFCQPRPFFDLPAVEIARCDTAEDIERALRRADVWPAMAAAGRTGHNVRSAH